MSPPRRLGVVLGFLAPLALLAGCGSDEFAEQSGDAIADAARADMKGLDSVRFTGTVTAAGSEITLDIHASASGDCTGSIGLEGGTAEFLSKDGERWYRPDEAFWRATIPGQADEAIEAVGDKWVVDTGTQISEFCNLPAFFDHLFAADDTGGSYATTGTDTVDGQEVVKVTRSDGDGSTTGYVLVEGEHHLVRIERTGGSEPASVEFGRFDDEFDVAAPAASDVVHFGDDQDGAQA